MSGHEFPAGPIERETDRLYRSRKHDDYSDIVEYTMPGGSSLRLELSEEGWIIAYWADNFPRDKLMTALALLYKGEITIDEFDYKVDGDDDNLYAVETQDDFDKFMGNPYSFLLSVKDNEDIEIYWEDGEFRVSAKKVENIRELIDLTASEELRQRKDEIIPSGN